MSGSNLLARRVQHKLLLGQVNVYPRDVHRISDTTGLRPPDRSRAPRVATSMSPCMRATAVSHLPICVGIYVNTLLGCLVPLAGSSSVQL